MLSGVESLRLFTHHVTSKLWQLLGGASLNDFLVEELLFGAG
jgi:hypothetical protein